MNGTFTRAERAVVDRLRTPAAVQRYLNELPYNDEPDGATLRSFRGVVRHGAAHCLEAALAAAVILEQHGYPPLVLSFESIDRLDHVIFVYRTRDGWGSIARSRDPGLHGRKPVFHTPRALALSYVDPYVDFSGRITAYAVVDLREAMGGYDWRLSEAKRLEGGAGAARLAASPDPHVEPAHCGAEKAVSRPHARARRPQADLLPRPRALEAAAGRIPV